MKLHKIKIIFDNGFLIQTIEALTPLAAFTKYLNSRTKQQKLFDNIIGFETIK